MTQAITSHVERFSKCFPYAGFYWKGLLNIVSKSGPIINVLINILQIKLATIEIALDKLYAAKVIKVHILRANL